MANIGDLVASLSVNTSDFKNGISESIGSLHELKSVFMETAGAFGVGFGVERFAEAIHGQFEEVTKLSHAAERFEMPVNSLVAFQEEAKAAHVEMEQFETGLTKMQKSIAEGGTRRR